VRANTLTKEEFYLVSLCFDEKGKVEEVDEERYLSTEQLREILEGINLEPVSIVLKQLEHENGWDGIVNDAQIKDCLELEQGIVWEGRQIKEIGLVGY
jgi:hypothetical protein